MLAHDLVHFAPLYAAVIAAGFIIAWPVAAGLARWRPRWRSSLFPLAGFVALAAILVAMNAALPITAISAARSPSGITGLCLAGALAGLVYVLLTRSQKSSSA
jgi:peptidoglycan/LPS O-acetylase OafA/YrhL